MNSTKAYDYHRVLITGHLKTCSALHVGSGEATPFQIPQKDGSLIDTEYSEVCLDVDNKPYLPASSLRGFLLGAARRLSADEDMQVALFGSDVNALKLVKDKDKDKKQQMQTGLLSIYDGIFIPPPTFIESENHDSKPTKPVFNPTGVDERMIRTSVALNPVLGVAESSQLFNTAIVPVGTEFKVQLLLSRVTQTELNFVLRLLACWDGSVLSALGGGVGKGRGRVQWSEQFKVEGLDDAGLKRWLSEDIDDLSKCYRVLPVPALEQAAVKQVYQQVEFTLSPQGSFLLHDPAYVKPKEKDDKPKEKDDKPEDNRPDLAFSRLPDGRALIPATALRGWVRGRARRILQTLGAKKTDELLNTLFGHGGATGDETGQRGLLWFDDVVSSSVPETYLQTFNAVDRFTGGVADGALYTVAAARCESLQGNISVLQSVDFPAWARGLLLLIARDMLEGELCLGWGKSRGFGQFKVTLNYDEKPAVETVEALRACFNHEHVEAWLKALHEALAQ